MHSFLPEGIWVTNEPQRTSAGTLGHLLFVFLILLCQDGHETRDWIIGCYATVDASQIAQISGLMKGETEHLKAIPSLLLTSLPSSSFITYPPPYQYF